MFKVRKLYSEVIINNILKEYMNYSLIHELIQYAKTAGVTVAEHTNTVNVCASVCICGKVFS